jgi:hypothetical protein
MKHVDWVQIALYANLAAIGVAMLTAVVLAWNNAGSKNIPLAAAALIGVMVGYLVQLPFELKRSRSYETIGVEFTIDRAQPVIRQWVYSDDPEVGWRLPAEVGASDWLAKNNPKAFETSLQRDKVALDLTMYSLVSYLTHVEYDWQLQRKSYGGLKTFQSVSEPGDCSSYIASDLKQQLSRAGNLFADAPLQVLPAGKLCLPPRTELEITSSTMTLRNPFCQLTFRGEHPAHMILNVHPKTRQYVALDGGQGPRYEIRQMGFSVEITFFALRAQHQDSRQYHDWASRVVDGARGWFAPGNPLEEPQRLVQPPPQ